MSRLSAAQLTVRKIDTLGDGVHGDGGNLYLSIKGQSRHWTVRYFSPTTHKRREIGIGSAYIITLAEARQVAIDIRRQVTEGIDPLELKTKAKHQKQIPNFTELAERYIEEQQR